MDRSQARNQNFSKMNGVSHYQCFHCHEWGHIRRFCRHRQNQNHYQYGEIRRPLSRNRGWRTKTLKEFALSSHNVFFNQQLVDRGRVFHSSGERKIWSKMKKINGGHVNVRRGICNKAVVQGMMNTYEGKLEELRTKLSSCNPEKIGIQEGMYPEL